MLCLHSLQPHGCTPPGSSAHGLLQARILDWVAISFPRGSSPPRDQTWVSCIADRFFTIWPKRRDFTFCLNSHCDKDRSRVASEQTGKEWLQFLSIYLYFLYIFKYYYSKLKILIILMSISKELLASGCRSAAKRVTVFCCHRRRCLGMTDVCTCTLEQVQILQWPHTQPEKLPAVGGKGAVSTKLVRNCPEKSHRHQETSSRCSRRRSGAVSALHWFTWRSTFLKVFSPPLPVVAARESSLPGRARTQHLTCLHVFGTGLGFPGGTKGKESACQCRRHAFDPWVRRITWRRKWLPASVFLPGFRGQRSLVDYGPQGHKELDTNGT